MNLFDLVERRAEGLKHDEDVPFDANWPGDREQLWLLLADAENIQKAAKDLVRELEAAFGRTLTENEAVRYGDRVYKTAPKKKTRIADPRAFAEWLGDDWDKVVPFSPSVGDKIKTTGLQAVCEKRGVDFKTARDTFLDTDWEDEWQLQAIPLGRAPKYLQGLDHGESTFKEKK